MKKLNIFRGVLLAGVLSIFACAGLAQELVSVTDSVTTNASVPGLLFSVDPNRHTSAVSTVVGTDLYKTPASNLSNTFPGLLSGLTVLQGSGEVGNNNASWLIRGIGSYGVGGFNVAKIFVDGFEVNSNYMVYLSPTEIESVSILKDAAALAAFGERGANGVIWIETKRGKVGPSTVTAQVRYGSQSPVEINKPLGSYKFASLYNQAVSNDNGIWSPVYSDEQLSNYQNGQGIDVDWYDQVFKNSGSFVDGDITFNGGSEQARYNVTMGYIDHAGLYDVNNTDETSNLKYSRYNVRANLDFKLLEIFEARVDLGGRIERRKRPNFGTSDLMSVLSRYPSNIYNVFDDQEQEHYSGTAIYRNNPVASIRGLGWYSNQSRILQGNFSLKEKLDIITPGLYLKQAFSFNAYTLSTYSKTKNYARYHHGETTTTDETTSITASGYGSAGMEDWKQGTITLGYDQEFGKHVISSAVNFHASAYNGDGYFSYKYRYVNYNGKMNYSYDNRYAGELSFSYFGNDSYAKGSQWALYPAISGAWIISNEDFMDDSNRIDYLKLRASVGRTGSSDSNATSALSSFSSNGRFLFKEYFTSSYVGSFYTGASSGTWQSTLVPMFISNFNTHAERSTKYNLGVDASVFGNLNVTADAYLDKRTDILTLDNSLMEYYGKNYYFSNIGEMTSKGFEVSAIWNGQLGGFSYALNGMVSYNTNNIDYMAEVAPAHGYNARTGRPFGTFIGLVADGFYDVTDFNTDGSLVDGISTPAFGAVQPGDIRYKDLDNNGMVDQNDVTSIGKSIYPEWTYAFGGSAEFKGFDLSILFQGIAGASVNLLDNWNQTVAFVDNGNAYPIAGGAWAYYPEKNIDTRSAATYPRLTTQSNANNYRTSSFWIKNRDFLKVRNIEVGYNFSKNKSLNLDGIKNLRIYVNATNPFTWSKLLDEYKMDPESIYGGYPSVKSINAGVTLTF
ncbi:SusC/RagA family TonB-linked outer membrane protein [Gaoshiqia sp. Z1-71]|uniref:SusC/RagA family TonB-linked outer membrane protein n=1 Tax=Gaoshiqia hydrogeniformans TaxID=3290090 RepID=UPI003BF81CEA